MRDERGGGGGGGGALHEDGVHHGALHLRELHAQAVDDEEGHHDQEGAGQRHGGGDVVLVTHFLNKLSNRYFIDIDSLNN